MMRTVVFVVEEASKEEFLREFLGRWELPMDVEVNYLVAEGHSALRRMIATKLRNWRKPNSTFIILCDQDSADCVERKNVLARQVPEYHRQNALVRIVCTELEGWYLVDRNALRAALPDIGDHPWPPELSGPPDSIHRPASRLADFASFRKRDLAREMGRRISLEPNTSHSFNLFVQTLRQILADAAG